MKFGYGFIVLILGMYLSTWPAADKKTDVITFSTRHKLANDQWYSIPYKVNKSELLCQTNTPNQALETATAVITVFDKSMSNPQPNVIAASKHKAVTIKYGHYANTYSYKAFYRFTDLATKETMIAHIAHEEAEGLYHQIAQLAEEQKKSKSIETIAKIFSLVRDIHTLS